MFPILIPIVAFIGVAAIVGAIALMFQSDDNSKAEDRLVMLTTAKGGAGGKGSLKESSVLAQPLDVTQNALAIFLSRFSNLSAFFEQANTSLTPTKFFVVSAGMGLVGSVVGAAAGVNAALVPLFTIFAAVLPTFWLLMRRKRRLRAFGKQLPDALELIARALRAGHSLQAGFNLAADEMHDPISSEFRRVHEEQNLGIPMDEALNALTIRVPNLDLKFFCTAVILQRSTGGDLAEILDKIGHLIRERFKIWGQVQALTGEGRLSGIVLLALPPLLFLAVYYLNPEYVMVLFTDPMGRKMLAGGVVMQLLGALVIRKIVNIRV